MSAGQQTNHNSEEAKLFPEILIYMYFKTKYMKN